MSFQDVAIRDPYCIIILQGNHQNRGMDETESEEVQLLSPMVFSQPINGHLSSNSATGLEVNSGDVTPLTKAQLSQVNYIIGKLLYEVI